MVEAYEYGRISLESLIEWYKANVNELDRNEATTRLHLIDRLIFGCLGWEQEDCITEEPYAKEFTDYTLKCPYRSLIIEAKKEGIYFELPSGHKSLEYSIGALSRDNIQIKIAIEQAMNYCQKRGTTLGVVSNGHQIISFVAVRQDGIPPMEGQAVIFDSLNTMLDNFFLFWKYLSKAGVQSKNLQIHLLGETRPLLPPKLSMGILSYPGNISRNVLQADLQIVGELARIMHKKIYGRSGRGETGGTSKRKEGILEGKVGFWGEGLR